MLDIKKITVFTTKNFSAIIFLLIPYSLVFSIFITEVILILLTILNLKNNSLKFKLLLSNNNLIKVLILFYLVILFSSIFNQNNSVIILKNLAYVRFIFYAISISLILNEFNYLKKYFLFSLVSCYLILFLGSLYEFILKKYCITFDESTIARFTGDFKLCAKKYYIGNLIRIDRISGFFGDEMIVGSYTSRLLPLISFLIFDQLKVSNKSIFIFFSILFISAAIIVLSGERVPLFYFILFLIISLLFVNIRFKFIVLFLLTLFSFLIINSSSVIKDRIYNQTYSQIFKTDGSMKFFSVEHQSHAVSALKIFKDNPVIGIGPKNYRYECRKDKYNISKYSCSTHPHNFYIQLLAETGILGLIIPLLIFIKIIIYFVKIFYVNYFTKSNKVDICKMFIYTSFLITLIPIIPTGNIFNNWLSIIFYLPLGFFINLKK